MIDHKALDLSINFGGVSTTSTGVKPRVEETQRRFIQPDYAQLEREEAEFNRVLIKIEREAANAQIGKMATTLKNLLSAKLTAYMVDVESERTIQRWAKDGVKDIAFEQMVRLRTAYELVLLLNYYGSEQIAKGWFVGIKPQLDYVTPIEAIRNNQLRDVIGAARAFITGG